MSRSQRFFLRLMPKKSRAAAEAESKQWIATCPGCGTRTSVWELGGLRYGAAGNPRISVKCRECGKRGIQQLVKET